MRYLAIDYNHLAEFPRGLGNFPNLVAVIASFNEIEALPTDIKRSPSLQTQVINNNRLRVPPETTST